MIYSFYYFLLKCGMGTGMGAKDRIKQIMPLWLWNGLKSCEEVYYERRMQRKCRLAEGFRPESFPFGVNLMGDIRAETGLGQSMRMVAGLLELGGIPFLIRQMDAPDSIAHQERDWDGKIASENKYGINLIHINNSIWRKNYARIPLEELSGRYNIAYWLWELEEFPEEWVSCIDTVDEIWTPAEFISRGIRKKTDKPVFTMPYGMELDTGNLLGRGYFHLPEDKFLFLVMYDFLSISERKNPKGIIRAYKLAFSERDSQIGMVIKVNHLKATRELDRLKRELEGYPNIYFITDNLSRREVESLVAASDVLVSLHRAEGFGLPLAEAMYLGTAVVATNWSSPMEFMDEDSACLVDYELVTLQEDVGPYRKGNRWADADVGQAAGYMKRLSEDREFFNGKVASGQRCIREHLDRKKMAGRMAERVEGIYGRRVLNEID